ncbi:MAG: S-layer homology domain-containing protein [Solobacterium sp.]|nr:S-layer homology domain-containing protein [Solobacterium sp.]
MSAWSETTDTYKAVSWAVTNGITRGYSDGGFHPDEAIKRKDAVIMMYRALSPDMVSEMKFNDVYTYMYPENRDTYRAIAWAGTAGIAKGYHDGRFCPLEICTREECITFAYRMYSLIHPAIEFQPE